MTPDPERGTKDLDRKCPSTGLCVERCGPRLVGQTTKMYLYHEGSDLINGLPVVDSYLLALGSWGSLLTSWLHEVTL